MGTVAADLREQKNVADATAAARAADALVPADAIVPIPNSAALAAAVEVAKNLALDARHREAPECPSQSPRLLHATASAAACVPAAGATSGLLKAAPGGAPTLPALSSADPDP